MRAVPEPAKGIIDSGKEGQRNCGEEGHGGDPCEVLDAKLVLRVQEQNNNGASILR